MEYNTNIAQTSDSGSPDRTTVDAEVNVKDKVRSIESPQMHWLSNAKGSETYTENQSTASTYAHRPDIIEASERSSNGGGTNDGNDKNSQQINDSNTSNLVLKPTKQSKATAATRDPFTYIRNNAEKKVVGLKHHRPDIRENEWLSSSRSIQSHPPEIPGKIRFEETTEGPVANLPPPPPPSTQLPKDTFDVLPRPSKYRSVEELEDRARRKTITNPFRLIFLATGAAFKVFGFYLITLESLIIIGLTIGLTIYWYKTYENDSSWSGSSLDFVLVAFAVTSPISAAIGMAFQRRERALIALADFRSFSYHLYLAHCLWDWPEGAEMGRQQAEAANKVVWLNHCDAVLAQLIGIGDELSRFLTLPTASRSRHRMTRSGRLEAARTMEVAYLLIESMTAQRLTRLTYYSERLKKIGLPSGEISRIRQYERFLSDVIEQLRMVKLYRTPQALRSFGRVFTILLPPFYAPVNAQVARDTQSLAVGITFGIITALALTALFESMEVLEDPFTAFLALDGIDAREELEVLHFSQMITTRKLAFPDAPEYPSGRRAALTHLSRKLHDIGAPPVQPHHTAASTTPSTAQQQYFRPPSVYSAPTIEGGTNHPIPAGDDTIATNTVGLPMTDIEAGYEDEELGLFMPPSNLLEESITQHDRLSVFSEDREVLGGDDPDASHHRLRRRKTHDHDSQTPPSLHSYSPGLPSWHSHTPVPSLHAATTVPPSHQGPPLSQQQGAPSATPSTAGSAAASPRQGSPPRHRRVRTGLSSAGLLPKNASIMRLPDY